jgi:hypothetical protein
MKAYHFALLRYVQSASSGERINVGVVMWVPDVHLLLARTNERYGRLSKLFPGFDGATYRQMIRHVQNRVGALSDRLQQIDALQSPPQELAEILEAVVPCDDGCLQWSDEMCGLSDSPADRLEELFAEFVTRHEQRQERQRREEADIRVALDTRIREAGLEDSLQWDVRVQSAHYDYTFQRGWRNGTLQVLEPISLDYLNPADVVDKANVWSGRLYALARDADFSLTGVVAPPQDPELQTAFEHAVSILRLARNVRRIVTESEVGTVVREIQEDLAH